MTIALSEILKLGEPHFTKEPVMNNFRGGSSVSA